MISLRIKGDFQVVAAGTQQLPSICVLLEF